jgi:hypothetical protein
VIRYMQQGKPRIDLKLGGADIFIMPIGASDKVNPPPVTPYLNRPSMGNGLYPKTGVPVSAALKFCLIKASAVIHQRRFTPSCGGLAPTAGRTVARQG